MEALNKLYWLLLFLLVISVKNMFLIKILLNIVRTKV